MSKFLQRIFVCTALMALPFMAYADDFQVSNSNFEDWSGAAFDGQPQAKGWNASNVEQVGIKFNFAHKETGHNGGYSLMVQDQDVGALGISATSPGYFALGKPWAYLPPPASPSARYRTHCRSALDVYRTPRWSRYGRYILSVCSYNSYPWSYRSRSSTRGRSPPVSNWIRYV